MDSEVSIEIEGMFSHICSSHYYLSVAYFRWYRKEKKRDPPTPEELRESMEKVDDEIEKEVYTEFVYRLLPYVVGRTVWENNATNSNLSSFVTPSLEAFAMLLYDNGYKPWLWECREMAAEINNGTSEDEDSAATPSKPTFKYTHRTLENMVRNGGWAEEGHDYFDSCYDKITIRRSIPGTGVKFEETFQRECADRMLGRKKRKVALRTDSIGPRRVRRHDLQLLNL